MKYRKKLIEVALPLPEINDASAFDKRPGIGPHPKGIHHWWARLPLPTARAVLFASVVNDPSANPEAWPTAEAQDTERERLFNIIRGMMDKRLHDHPAVYAAARAEVLKQCDGKLPTVFDPFSGGGSIPLEAYRIGFDTLAADLNPVAVLLNKCNLELAPRWMGIAPVNPDAREQIGGTESWRGTAGLAEDVRYYGELIRHRAIERIGTFFPKAKLPKEYGGGEADVIAWIWARTVASPNPAAHGKHVPLISTYWLTSKKGSEAWLHPLVDKAAGTYRFEVRKGPPTSVEAIRSGTKGKKGFRCLLTDEPIPFSHVRDEGNEGRLGYMMIAVVVKLPRGRGYIGATEEQTNAAASAEPENYPDTDLPDQALGFRVQNYGVRKHYQMFIKRQLLALVELSDQIKRVAGDIRRDAAAAGLPPESLEGYVQTVVTFLALALGRSADHNNALCRWDQTGAGQRVKQLFGRQAVPMVWDFAEANILGAHSVSWKSAVDITAEAIESLVKFGANRATAGQYDAARYAPEAQLLVSTDPPYYDNIGYAALSDFFYVWLRRTIGGLYPDLFSTVLVPKLPELIASPERFEGNKEKAKEHFESGFRKTFTSIREKLDPRFPLTVYYAFKQDDEEGGSADAGENSPSVDLTTGWETLLEALMASGFQITGTWPVRASQAWRMRAIGSNALASYIVLACRPRPADAALGTRRDFLNALKQELPDALKHLQQGNIAPVDLAQSAIGPGMAVFSRYGKVMEADGSPMRVRTALSLINQTLDEVLAEQEGEFDPDTRWALAWFEQFGTEEGLYGVAETLSKAKNTAVNGLVEAGVVKSKGGKVQLLGRHELPKGWDPLKDKRLTVWETTQHLIRVQQNDGESAAASLMNKLGGIAETARELAYRLFAICERKKWADEALAYNGLVIAWPELTKLATSERARGTSASAQGELF